MPVIAIWIVFVFIGLAVSYAFARLSEMQKGFYAFIVFNFLLMGLAAVFVLCVQGLIVGSVSLFLDITRTPGLYVLGAIFPAMFCSMAGTFLFYIVLGKYRGMIWWKYILWQTVLPASLWVMGMFVFIFAGAIIEATA